MSKKPLVYLAMIVLAVMVLSACGAKSADGGGTGGNKVGDPVEVKDKNLVITMDSSAINTYKVTATFTIENKGTADFAMDAKTTFIIDGTNGDEKVKLELDAPSCGAKMIKGPVPAGGKVTGDLCWRGDPTLTWVNEAEISFGGAAGAPGVVSWKVSVTE